MKTRTTMASTLVAGLVVLLAGCSSGKRNSTVEGTVTYQGKALPGGTVTFHTEDGKKFPALISSEGKYRVTQIPKGKMTVTIETEYLKPKKETRVPGDRSGGAMAEMRKRAQKEGGGSNSTESEKQAYVKIPDKYSKTEETPFKDIEIDSGKNEQPFELTD